MNTLHESRELPPVSIAIAIVGCDFLLMAADSQTTRDNIKRTDAEKVSSVKIVNCNALIAEAGNADRSRSVIDAFVVLSQDAHVTDYRSVADLFGNAMLKVRQEIRKQRFDCSAEDLAEYFRKEEQQSWFMCGHYFEKCPYVYTAELAGGSVSKSAGANQESHFAAIGTGADLAVYLLGQHSKPAMGISEAPGLALYVIGEVKKHDAYCSGQTRIYFLKEKGRAFKLAQPVVDELCAVIENFNAADRPRRNQELAKLFNEVGIESAEKHKRAFTSVLELPPTDSVGF